MVKVMATVKVIVKVLVNVMVMVVVFGTQMRAPENLVKIGQTGASG